MILNEFFNLPQVFEKNMTEGVMSEIDLELRDIVAREDFDALYELFSANTPAGRYVQDMYDDVVIDAGLHPDDDFERIEQIVFDRLADDFGEPDMAEGAPISIVPGGDKGGAVDNFKQQMANRTEVQYQQNLKNIHQGINELSSDLLQKSAQVAKDKSDQAMDPKIHDALGGGYMNPVAKHYDSLSQKFSNRAVKVGQRDAVKKIASPAVMRKIGMAEGLDQDLTIQQLATISDATLDKAYGYGRSTPGNTFGWQANLMSAAYAKKMIDAGVTDIEKISDAIHKGWNVTAQKFVQNSDQFDDTEKLRQAGKLEAKLQQRAKLMKINYAQLDNEEQEKDRVVARALLQAIKGQKGVAEAKDDYVPPKEANYGPEYQAMVKRVGQKARAQEKAKQQQPKAPVRESRLALLKQIIQS